MGSIILIVLIIWFVIAVNQKNQKNTRRGTNLNGKRVYTGANYSGYQKPGQNMPLQQYTAPNSGYQPRQVQNNGYQQKSGQVSQQELKRRLQQKYANTAQQYSKGNTYQMPQEQTKEQKVFVKEKTKDQTEPLEPGLGIADSNQESPVLKQVNDLIVMGYSGDLSFERDFVAEGVEMLNSYEL